MLRAPGRAARSRGTCSPHLLSGVSAPDPRPIRAIWLHVAFDMRSVVFLAAATVALRPLPALPRRAWLGSAAGALLPTAAQAALGPPLFDTSVKTVELTEEEVNKLLGSYGAKAVDVLYAPNNATLSLLENECNEMERLGYLVKDPVTKLPQLRTFTPLYTFPIEPGENFF